MGEYKPGDKVEFREFPTAGADHVAGTKRTGVIVYGPYKERKHLPPVVLIETEEGLCVAKAVTIINPAPPEPEWEYGYRRGQFVEWFNKPDSPMTIGTLQYRQQVGKPETIEHLTPEEVEELRNE